MQTESRWPALAASLADPGSPLGARGARLCSVLELCLGPRPAGLAALDPPEPPGALRPLRIGPRDRAALHEAVQEVLDGLLAREVERIEPHLDARIATLWPDATLAVHDREALLAAIDAHRGEAAPVVLRDVRSYTLGELRGVRPRGEAERLAAAAEAPLVAVTAGLDSRRGRLGRALVWAAPGDDGRWRVQTLALPSPDDVVTAGRRASAHEDEAVRVADKVVRHWALGHAAQLRSSRNHLMAKLWLDGELLSAEALVQARMQRATPDASSWWVFGGSRAAPRTSPTEALGADLAREVERRAKEAWKRPWPRLRAQWVRTELGQWDPERRAVQRPRVVQSLLLAQEDVDARDERTERWRLAGLFGAPD